MKKDLPVVAIIGRPNVGKSTLFNTFLGERRSIVSDIPGTTRDSLMEKITDLGKVAYWLVDTAGLSDFGDNNLENEIQLQAEIAIKNADLILWVVDGRAELTTDDYEIAQKMRKNKTPLVFLANKIDDGDLNSVVDLAQLGFGMPEVISAKNNFGFWEFTENLQEKLVSMGYNGEEEAAREEEEDPDTIKIAFVGRPNVGKSSLLNKLIGSERAVVSDVAGTTRDSIDTLYTDESGQKFCLIDTAGLRKPGKIERNFEFWSSVRTNRSIERADICALLIDALDGVTHQDLALAGKILKAGKGVILCVNKFDLVREKAKAKEETDEREHETIKMWDEDITKIRDKYLYYLKQKIQFMPWAPALFFSAKTGKDVDAVLESAKGISAERKKRIPTSALNLFIPEIYYGHVAPMVGTKKGKIKMVSQVDVSPPKFIFFVNNADAFHFSYKRYMENKLREKYNFFGTPISIDVRDAMHRFRGSKKQLEE